MRNRTRSLVVAAALLAFATACSGHAGSGASATVTPSVTPSGTLSGSPSPRLLHVVGLGDSVMSGTHCGCAGLAQEYATGLATRTGDKVAVTNFGAGGATTDDLLDDVARNSGIRTRLGQADVVLVTIGANDLLPTLDAWENTGCDEACFSAPATTMGHRLGSILAAIHQLVPTGARVLVTNYWNVFADGDAARSAGGQAQIDWSEDVTAVANQAICAASQAAGDTCVDLVPAFKAGGTDPTPLLATDGDHPNAEGVRQIVRALLVATPTSL